MLAGLTMAQSGHRPITSNSGGISVSVVAKRDNDRSTPVTSREVAVFDNGIEQATVDRMDSCVKANAMCMLVAPSSPKPRIHGLSSKMPFRAVSRLPAAHLHRSAFILNLIIKII